MFITARSLRSLKTSAVAEASTFAKAMADKLAGQAKDAEVLSIVFSPEKVGKYYGLSPSDKINNVFYRGYHLSEFPSQKF
jgi:hypothetical protein